MTRVAKPERGEEMERGILRPPIGDRDLDEHVLRSGLGVLDVHVKVAVILEDTRVDKLVLRLEF